MRLDDAGHETRSRRSMRTVAPELSHLALDLVSNGLLLGRIEHMHAAASRAASGSRPTSSCDGDRGGVPFPEVRQIYKPDRHSIEGSGSGGWVACWSGRRRRGDPRGVARRDHPALAPANAPSRRWRWSRGSSRAESPRPLVQATLQGPCSGTSARGGRALVGPCGGTWRLRCGCTARWHGALEHGEFDLGGGDAGARHRVS